jgi:hypothetical protein
MMKECNSSHCTIGRTSSTFRRSIINVLLGIFDVARFAMETILSVDLKFGFSLNFDIFVHSSRTISRFWSLHIHTEREM